MPKGEELTTAFQSRKQEMHLSQRGFLNNEKGRENGECIWTMSQRSTATKQQVITLSLGDG